MSSKASGRRYAEDQIQGAYFQEWVAEQLIEASEMDPSKVIPLETKADARKVARNMFQQLQWDMKRDVNESAEFFRGVSEYLREPEVVDWLADEVLYRWGEIAGSETRVSETTDRGEAQKIVDGAIRRSQRSGGKVVEIDASGDLLQMVREILHARSTGADDLGRGDTEWSGGIGPGDRWIVFTPGAAQGVSESPRVAEARRGAPHGSSGYSGGRKKKKRRKKDLPGEYAVLSRGPLGDEIEHGVVSGLTAARSLAGQVAASGARVTIRGPLDEHGEADIVEIVAPTSGTTRESPVVSDFTTLNDLIGHAANDLGATHTSGEGAHTKIYFPRGGQYPYEEAKVWRKGGYWHAEGPHARAGVERLPADALPIARARGRRAAETSRGRRSGKIGTTTKPGAHGTLYLYEVVYTDPSDHGMGHMTTRMWAYNLEHVEQKFYDNGEGWHIISIARVPKDAGMHRATRHRPTQERRVPMEADRVVLVPTADIETEHDVQASVRLDVQRLLDRGRYRSREEWARAALADREPVELYEQEDGSLLLGDGNHRYYAAVILGRDVPATIGF